MSLHTSVLLINSGAALLNFIAFWLGGQKVNLYAGLFSASVAVCYGILTWNT